MAPAPLLVFTDLDGTLLDHHTYRWDAAGPALEALGRVGALVVLCSSKTRAEMEAVQADLRLSGPLIVENGGAVVSTGAGVLESGLPDRVGGRPAKVFGTAYAELRRALEALREELGADLRGFGDLSPAEVARVTGLPEDRARLAKAREFDEPFFWEPAPSPAEVARAREILAGRGLRLTRGGRFWHLMGPNDKGRAVAWLIEQVSRVRGRPRTLALGDGENDLPMLCAVDEGVVVERGDGGHLAPLPPGLRKVPGRGPVGWNRAVLDWLARHAGGEP